MPENWDNVNLGNPSNARRDAEERNDAKVTNADHPNMQIGVEKDERGRSGVVVEAGNAGVVVVSQRKFDSHGETVHDPELEMPGERTSHVDPLSRDTGMHAVSVGVGATAGGALAGAAAGLAAGAVAGPLGAALGAAVGTTIGAIGGGYAGKHLAEKVNPTCEDHHWRNKFASRDYVSKGATYEEWEPAYEFGIEMRQWLLDKTWEEAEEMIRSGWESSEDGKKMPWGQARLAIQDAWDHLTPEPGEEEVTEKEREED